MEIVANMTFNFTGHQLSLSARDQEHVMRSKAIIAYIGISACGVGAEIEMARRENIPIILLFESSKFGSLPQLILGNPNVKILISFDKTEEIDAKLSEALTQVLAASVTSISISDKSSGAHHEKQTETLAEKKVYICGTFNTPSQRTSNTSPGVIETVTQTCDKINTKYAPDEPQARLYDSSPRQIWREVRRLINDAGVVVADVSIPDCNTGAQIEMAHTANVPVILLIDKSKQNNLSRLILGNPEVKRTVAFDNLTELSTKLKKELILTLSEKYLKETAFFDDWSYRTFYIKQEELLQLNQAELKGVKLRLTKPVSCKDWLNSVRKSDRTNGNRKQSNSRLDEFV
ncbi:MAG: hypothetical protein ABSD42_03720 [Candidatus Bathyarchaeia archaeon]